MSWEQIVNMIKFR